MVSTLMLVAWLFVTTIQEPQDSDGKVGIRPPTSIVGVWKGEHGSMLNFRPDGTARGRSSDDPNNTVHYYKYRLNGDRLSIYYSAKPDEYLRRMRQAALGMTVDKYDLTKLDDSALQLIDSASGTTFVFERTEDSTLVAAP